MGWLKRLFGKKETSVEDKLSSSDSNREHCNSKHDAYIGQTFANRYVLEKDFTQSAWASFYLGYDLKSENVVVLKVPNTEAEDFYQRHRNEVFTLERLEHDGIVKTYPHFEIDGYPVLVMERVAQKCKEYFAGCKIDKETFYPRVVDFMEELGSVVEYLVSEEVYHMDIKPQNILVTSEKRLKLIDFNFSKDKKNPNDVFLSPGLIIGTPRYIPPEGSSGFGPTETYEVYSVGLLGLIYLYNFIHNRLDLSEPPYKYETFAETLDAIQLGEVRNRMLDGIRNEYPEGLISLLGKLTLIDPMRRVNPKEMNQEIALLKSKI